ncbi:MULTISPECIES: exodeoxyribonuclease V subunit alpha [unclassified Thiomonas]|uniref:exodeoxyribonuclease V subunit alpha n=1 Tax=unclassified Thiomonas TaxID=2625466 RepID=UPI0004DB9FB6|nr:MULTISPECIES: exodeoxyribonuclease V subunit alpha [unclassified Thiomonas]CDW94096.1 exonuclease V (RecBCD complex), alpha chain [Thiomonas sp. CB2]VDY04555.1 exonuclease V (RecBCD complex), alpha chain [Thiomonas sp. Bio17B3]VDY08273.1 exonuclease V (RecBCD complex), alpha chain [Thiomonas sp. Sup16B3]VDY12808.1 putative exodeoxyribonuclease V, alpha subunit recD [Thiomonas sp. OC7]VDY17984.1 exonuclease V (RecBCD complex), alpha chain [Thiomonas sp. CB2]
MKSALTNTPNAPTQRVLDVLHDWAEQGVLRRLDAALARFLAELCPQMPPELAVAVALLADLEGRGHTCVLLGELPQHFIALKERAATAGAPALSPDVHWPDDGERLLRECPAVYCEGEPDNGAPLILSAVRLYLRRYWQDENTVAARIHQRLQPEAEVDAPAAAALLARLFPSANDTEVDWQKLACALALRGRFTLLTGGPGTGKTHTAARLLALLWALRSQPGALRVALAAPTGKAAARLKQAIDRELVKLAALPGVAELSQRLGPARTLHSLLGARPDTRRFARNAAQPLEVDVLLVDEASMIHLEMMAALLDALPPTARLILLGDKDQLASVEAGAVLGELCTGAEQGRYTPQTAQALQALCGDRIPQPFIDPAGPALLQRVVMLRKSHRFGGPIGQLAQAVNAGDAERAQTLLQQTDDAAVRLLAVPQLLAPVFAPVAAPALVDLAVQGRDGAKGYAHYAELLRQGPTAEADWDAWAQRVLQAFDQCRVLCAVREGPWGVQALNEAIAARLDALGLLHGRGAWYAGRPVMVTRNDHDLGVLNGDVGIALPTGTQGLRGVFLQGQSLRSVSISRLADVQTAFAMTVHQSQGSEFDHTVLVLPERHAGLSRELIYTGITRARRFFTLACADMQTLHEGIQRVTQRASGLLSRIDKLPA